MRQFGTVKGNFEVGVEIDVVSGFPTNKPEVRSGPQHQLNPEAVRKKQKPQTARKP